MENKKKRVRRTYQELEKDLFNAISSLVKKEGFGKITFVNISNEAKVNMSVLVRRYGKVENLIELYTQKFDYFLNDILYSKDLSNIDDSKKLFHIIAERFVTTLHRNKEMQELMIWELAENNPITRKSTRRREKTLMETLDLYRDPIKHSGIYPNAFLALITAGMYYILLRKDRSTLCGIDFHSKEGRKILIETLFQLTSLLVDKSNEMIRKEE